MLYLEFITALKEHILLQRRTTSSEDDPSFDAVISGSNFERENSNSKKNNNSSKKVSTSLALQIVDSDQDNTKSGSCTSLTLAQEMASFEYIGKMHACIKVLTIDLKFEVHMYVLRYILVMIYPGPGSETWVPISLRCGYPGTWVPIYNLKVV